MCLYNAGNYTWFNELLIFFAQFIATITQCPTLTGFPHYTFTTSLVCSNYMDFSIHPQANKLKVVNLCLTENNEAYEKRAEVKTPCLQWSYNACSYKNLITLR